MENSHGDTEAQRKTKYEGPARVEYTDPAAIARGTAVAELGEFERHLVELWVDGEAEPEGLEEFGVLHLMGRVTEHPGEGVVTFDLDPTQEVTPSRLIVDTPEGVFSSNSVKGAGGKVGGAGSELICLSLLRAEFDAVGAGKAEYWILPPLQLYS